ncbi:helix-turn-helix transcriptional regulator [Hymenobacter sp. BT442]|uniref:Helix-turn-helix transcriptional regulator n=2 Tax=Hymenobacter negativus TaxID=2795026 RepID=A0ABS0QCG3_9BACT|nr:helix-turn-helix transcriptional regulator [Hymenobacter negativus]
MVCARGIRVVRRELEILGLRVLDVRLGAATVAGTAESLDWPRIRQALTTAGFALLEDPAHQRVARIKQAVTTLLRRPDTLRHRDFMPALALETGLSVRRLHACFARLPGHDSLLSYITRQRVTYAQELLATSRSGIGRIARQLGYGSLAHFSGQFRRFAQCSPSAYRQQLETAAASTAPNDASHGLFDAKPEAASPV